MSYIKECRCLKNVIHQIDRNVGLLLSAFQHGLRQIWVGICLNSGKRFFLRGFILKPTERAQVLLKTVLGIFKIPLHLRDRHVFMWQSLEILNVFYTLKLIFWKPQTRFKKSAALFFSYQIQSATFPYKTALSEANVKASRMVNTKWAYHKERSFAVTILFFRKFCFILRTSYKELIWRTNHPNIHIHTFESDEVLFECAFSLWVSLRGNLTCLDQGETNWFNDFITVNLRLIATSNPLEYAHFQKGKM